jgi:hypothetical protein
MMHEQIEISGASDKSIVENMFQDRAIGNAPVAFFNPHLSIK